MEIEEAVNAVGNFKSLGMAIIGIVVVIGIIKAITANGVEGIAGNLLGLVTVVCVIFLLIGAFKFIFSKNERYSYNLLIAVPVFIALTLAFVFAMFYHKKHNYFDKYIIIKRSIMAFFANIIITLNILFIINNFFLRTNFSIAIIVGIMFIIAYVYVRD